MKVQRLFTGKPKKVLDIDTSIIKNEVGSLDVFLDYIEGDEVSNKKHHGGKNRVLHQIPIENYDILGMYFSKAEINHGKLGENILSIGMNEKNVCIGDTYKVGNIECIVTEPRKPCWTIDHVLGQKGIAKFIQDNCLTGWFYKILKEGSVNMGDSFELISRPFPKLTIENCIQALLIEPDTKLLELMISNPELSSNWKNPAQRILESGKLEDDSLRLKS